MSVPSGDQTGLRCVPVVRRTGALPSTEILNKPSCWPSLPPVASHFPSGDQDGVPWTSIAALTAPDVEPSDRISNRVCLSLRLSEMAIWLPSADTAGGWRRTPSDPFQISEAWPPSKRHRPSLPPLDDR